MGRPGYTKFRTLPPGAAIPALGTGRWEVALFLAAVIVGFWLRRVFASLGQPRVAS